MMTSSNGDIFRVAGHLCGEFTGDLRRHRDHYDVNVMNFRILSRQVAQSYASTSTICPILLRIFENSGSIIDMPET